MAIRHMEQNLANWHKKLAKSRPPLKKTAGFAPAVHPDYQAAQRRASQGESRRKQATTNGETELSGVNVHPADLVSTVSLARSRPRTAP